MIDLIKPLFHLNGYVFLKKKIGMTLKSFYMLSLHFVIEIDIISTKYI